MGLFHALHHEAVSDSCRAGSPQSRWRKLSTRLRESCSSNTTSTRRWRSVGPMSSMKRTAEVVWPPPGRPRRRAASPAGTFRRDSRS